MKVIVKSSGCIKFQLTVLLLDVGSFVPVLGT